VAEKKRRRRLTDQQAYFTERYVTHWNASRAAREAGYSEGTAGQIGHQLLQNSLIRERISERLDEAAMPAREALARLANHARADLDDVLDEAGRFDLQKARGLGVTHLIKKLKVATSETEDGTFTTYTVEAHDAQAALINILKAHGAFEQKVKLDATISGLADLFAAIDPSAATPV
jgi:phage terminase small subunit